MKTAIALLFIAVCAHAQTNTFTILSATTGVGKSVKCLVQSGRSSTNILLSGADKAMTAYKEMESSQAASDKLEAYIDAEEARLQKVMDNAQDAGIGSYSTGSPLDRDLRALKRKKEELRVANSRKNSAEAKFDSLSTVRAVFTRQVYGGMQVWRVVPD